MILTKIIHTVRYQGEDFCYKLVTEKSEKNTIPQHRYCTDFFLNLFFNRSRMFAALKCVEFQSK